MSKNYFFNIFFKNEIRFEILFKNSCKLFQALENFKERPINDHSLQHSSVINQFTPFHSCQLYKQIHLFKHHHLTMTMNTYTHNWYNKNKLNEFSFSSSVRDCLLLRDNLFTFMRSKRMSERSENYAFMTNYSWWSNTVYSSLSHSGDIYIFLSLKQFITGNLYTKCFHVWSLEMDMTENKNQKNFNSDHIVSCTKSLK